MQLQPLGVEEAALIGATHRLILTHADITMATVDTAQTIEAVPVAAKMGVQLVDVRLKTAFQDSADAASIITAITVGDGGSTTRFLASTELNANGTEIWLKGGVNPNPQPYVYTAADTVDVVFLAPTSGKNLAALDTGEVHLYFKITDARFAGV